MDWLFRHGVMSLSTPLSGSWLNLADSLQRIIVKRALAGEHPQTPDEIITWLEDRRSLERRLKALRLQRQAQRAT